MAKTITLELTTSNVGPHESLSAKLVTSSIDLGVYANNGMGKTFLSRAFRIVTKSELSPDDSTKLLTIGKNAGAFKFKLSNTQEPGVIREFEIQLNRNVSPVVSKNSTGYLFRVFNSDYVKENLDVQKYRPDGQIEGYILGKEKIDLSKEKAEVEKLAKEFAAKEQKLKKNVTEAKADLDNLGIRKNTSEYLSVDYNNLIDKTFAVSETETFTVLTQRHNQLKSLPDNLPDIKNIDIIKQKTTLQDIRIFLKEKFTRSLIAEDFKTKVKQKQDFVETGINLLNKNKNECPFCEQDLSKDALLLIDKYLEYLSETEALQVKRANDLILQLNGVKKEFSDLYKSSLKVHTEYLKNQKYIPSLSDKKLSEVKDSALLDVAFKTIQTGLEKKKEDITTIISSKEIDETIISINTWFSDSNKVIQTNGVILELFNEKKNNTNAERLELNRRLCRARFIELKQSKTELINEITELTRKVQSLQIDIAKKEQSEKVSKKGKIIETFKDLLSKMFDKKYSFDETTFCIKFQNHLLETNASDVLSDGEKSIVAFCYYIAETHKVIEKEEDYQKLFFIIDDPISSQDFHFVYATSQIIRTLNKKFGISKLRLILLTHNLEFMSIIIRNKIIDQKYILTNGKLEPLSNELIMPYEEHLRDIYDISKGKKNASHTTPNSIRHILETINHFVSPDKGLNIFCEGIEGYAENEFLFSLMHDGSHGTIRIQKAYTEDMIKRACDVVINYITKEFSGQINQIST